jgi:hypothetical protein
LLITTFSSLERQAVAKRSAIGVLDRFAKAKKMPLVSRVSGGGVRAVYYRNPSKVRVIRGKRVNGTRSAGSPTAD